MKILIDVIHPAHVHLFKNAIWKLEARGHQIAITCREKDVTRPLLEYYGFRYQTLSSAGKGLFWLLMEAISKEYRLYKFARRFRPDILVGGPGNIFIPHVAFLLHKPSIIFEDKEHTKLQLQLYLPFVSIVCTTTSFTANLGKKHIKYNGCDELAYLHPNYFKPDPSVLDRLDCLTEDDRYIIIRLVSWNALHDIGRQGFLNPRKIISRLEHYGKVFITSERKLDTDLEKYRIDIPPEKLHDLLYYATLCIGESATIAAECAALGTPAIYVSTLRLGYLDEEEYMYGLVYNFSEPEVAQEQAIGKALELLQKNDLKQEWQVRRGKLLQDKIDVTEFMVKFIESYPQTVDALKKSVSTGVR